MSTKRIILPALTLACLAPSMAVNLDHVAAHASGLRLFALGAAALMSVGMAALLPFAIRESLRGGRHVEAAGLLFMLVACWSFNISNALGASSVLRADSTGERAANVERHDRLKADIAKAEASRAALAQAAGEQTPAMAEAELRALQADPLWRASDQCVTPRGPSARTFCADYARRQGVHAAAVKVADLDREIREGRAALVTATTAHAGQPADPQADSIARGALILAGWRADPVAVGVGLSWLFALVLELIASAGPIVIEGRLRAAARPATGDVIQELPRAVVAPPAVEPVQRAPKATGEAPRPLGGEVGDQPVTQSHQVGGAAKKGGGRRKTPSKPPSKKTIPDNVLRFSRPVGGAVGDDVAGMAAQGMSTREIAAQTGLSRWQVRKRLNDAAAAQTTPEQSPAGRKGECEAGDVDRP